MRNVALIDADSIIWAASYSNEYILDAMYQIKDWFNNIITKTECNEYKVFLGGTNNFRYIIRSDYKANRKKREKPELFDVVMQHVIDEYNPFISNGCETDDSIVATAKWCIDNDYEPIIVTIDKDYKTKPYTIYNYAKDTWLYIDEYDAVYNQCHQMLTGDTSDNIHTCSGIGKVKANKILGDKKIYGLRKAVIATYIKFYGKRWKHKFIETYNLINLVDDYKIISIPKEFDFVLI